MDSGEEPLDFSLKGVSLKELSLIRVAHILWKTPEIVKSLNFSKRNISYLNFPDETTEKDLLEKISLLPVPERLKKQIIPLVYHVGREICDWIEPYRGACKGFRSYLDEIFRYFLSNDHIRWTHYGTIDTYEMAKLMVHQQEIPISARYHLACQFCLEEEIRRLWVKMIPYDRKFMMEKDYYNGPFNIEPKKTARKSIGVRFPFDGLTRYWSFKMANKFWNYVTLHRDDVLNKSPEGYVMMNAVNSEYSTISFMFNYFWPKLDNEQQKRMEEITCDFELFEGIVFLISRMERNQQIEVLRENPSFFLQNLLNRRWHHVFFPVLNVLKEHVEDLDFRHFLSEVTLKDLDDSTLVQFYSVLRPLTRNYLPKIVSEMFYAKPDRERARLEFVKQLAMDAPLSTKRDVIAEMLPKCRPGSDGLNRVKELVLEWFTSATWPALKKMLYRKIGKEELIHFNDSFQSLDHHFAVPRSNEVDGGACSSKSLKIG